MLPGSAQATPHSFEKQPGPLRDAVSPLGPATPLLRDRQAASLRASLHAARSWLNSLVSHLVPGAGSETASTLQRCCATLSPTTPLLQDWQIAKNKQDQHLDNIEKGLSTLKGIGESMGEALKTQDVLLDTIDEKVSGTCPKSVRRAA